MVVRNWGFVLRLAGDCWFVDTWGVVRDWGLVAHVNGRWGVTPPDSSLHTPTNKHGHILGFGADEVDVRDVERRGVGEHLAWVPVRLGLLRAPPLRIRML